MLMSEEQLFAQAIEIDGEAEREAFVAESCADDPELYNKLRHLVNMHFSSGRLLDETRGPSAAESLFAASPEAGEMIGPYKLLQEIGTGGMGVVFMAEQTAPVQRKVAVKVIKLGMDTRRVIARFESERQALAMMDHPCITRVLDAGCTTSGRPYFVMDLVHGKSITEYCDQRKVPLRQRLEIFVQVCGAVEHAHQKGIIHRDIKPSNIMVTSHDGQPLPKIIDFGIAKAIDQRLTDKTLFTNYGEMIGTPLYMSPEQAEMSEPDVDTRSDVYSLGVLLYELVTGSTPFADLKDRGFHEIRQAIRSTDPVLASTRISKLGETVDQITENRSTDADSLKRFVRGELDWILAKCLARDRSQRYQSAGELSREIQRYLNGDVVEAARPSLGYRARKFVARHRGAAAMAATMALVLLSCTVLSVALAMRASNAEQLAQTRLQEVVAQRDRALRAETRLARLEREQRNQAAVNEAIAMHNANMVKRHIRLESGEVPEAGPAIFVKPVSALWNSNSRGMVRAVPPVPSPEIPSAPPQQKFEIHRQFTIQTAPDVDLQVGQNIEVVVLSDEMASKTELLKCIADAQIKKFGDRDVAVAATLNQLGEVMARQKNWHESEKFYRQALGIVESLSDADLETLGQIRLNLIACLKDRGDVQQAIEELEKYRGQLEASGLMDHASQWLRKLQLDDLTIELRADDYKDQ
jgi:serine/threonine protein kinase